MRLVYRWMLTLNDAPSRWPCIADELQYVPVRVCVCACVCSAGSSDANASHRWAGSERYAAFVWPQVLLVPSGVGAGAVQVEDVVRLRASPPDAWLDDHRAVVLDAGDHVLVVGAARDIASTWPDAACFPVAARATDVALVAAALDKPGAPGVRACAPVRVGTR